jgi:hypothetical protein
VSAFFGPRQFEAERLQPDDFGRLNEQGRLLHLGGYDFSGEIGGYVPGFKDHLFFFGSFNPSWNRQFNRLADLHGAIANPLVGTEADIKQHTYNYAGKLTLKLSDKHVLESSIFGDPTRSDTGPFQTLETFSPTTFSKLSNGTRNWVARYNATLSPTWLFNASFSWGHNYFDESPLAPDVYGVQNQTGCGFSGVAIGSVSSCRTPLVPGTLNGPLGPLTGIYISQGLGFLEKTTGDNYSLNFDTQKIVNKLGSHAFSVGYHYERNFYDGTRNRTGPCFHPPSVEADEVAGSTFADDPAMAAVFSQRLQGVCDNAAFYLRLTPSAAFPTMFVPGVGLAHVRLLQARGEFENPQFNTTGHYHAAYLNDAWTINKHVTVNIGWRWEQQYMAGSSSTDLATGQPIHPTYTFTDNWSPRIGLAIDPKGDRKTKVYGNFARYSYAIPLDLAIRSLSNENDLYGNYWRPQADAAGNVIVDPNGVVQPDFSAASYLAGGGGAFYSADNEPIAPGTKMQYLQEWVAGVQHEFPKGIVVDVRWMDRRLKRIVEDLAGISPEAFAAGIVQNYTIANPNGATDLYINPIQQDFGPGVALPASCAIGTSVNDTFGNDLGSVCILNPATAGHIGSDGKPDGFVNPVRIYKAIEVEINKAFSAGWQLRTNYRWSTLRGNYEGAFRNDNGQSDPSISSLFDFVAGDFGLLGDQFRPGFLNTDRRHIVNSFISYTFASGFLKNLTVGTGVRIESGIPINDLKAHPVYLNPGEIPVGFRGKLGRTDWDGQADVHTEYALKLNEKHALHFGADLFNITNQKTQLRVDQNEDRSFGVANADFLKPTQGNVGFSPGLAFQAPFHARLFAKWVF